MPVSSSQSGKCIEIRPPGGWAPADLRELWEYRDLIWILALRDIKVRYKQTALGIVWAVAPPLLTMIIFNVLFSVLLGAERRPTIPGVPYAVSTFCALVVWQLFANSLRNSGSSLLHNRGLITKVYFPRLVVPLAPVLAALVDFAVAFTVLLGLIAGYAAVADFEFSPGLGVLSLPVFILLAILTALSVSIWISALSAVYRDFNFVGPYTVQLLMYVTPVVYAYESIAPALGEWGSMMYGLNPMAGVVEGFRWSLLGTASPPWALLVSACGIDLLLLVAGLVFFRRMEQVIVDVI